MPAEEEMKKFGDEFIRGISYMLPDMENLTDLTLGISNANDVMDLDVRTVLKDDEGILSIQVNKPCIITITGHKRKGKSCL